jgi:acetyl-CoA carboxylase beta subunit
MTNKTQLRAHGAPGEKRGNTSWVSCPACKEWFHTTEDLISRATIALHCPHCGHDFLPDQAARILVA